MLPFPDVIPSAPDPRGPRRTSSNMTTIRTSAGFLGLAALFLSSCTGGSAGPGGGAGSMDLVQVSHGFGQVLPHKTFALGEDGLPTPTVMSIRTMDELLDNVRVGNPVHPTPTLPETAILPNGDPGNQFLMLEFTQDLMVESVLTAAPGQIDNNSFAGTVLVEQVDPLTGTTTLIPGRAFINGFTYGTIASGSPPQLPYEQWINEDGSAVDTNEDGNVDAADLGWGYPGTETPFQGMDQLTNARTMVFIPDADGDLATHETFPTGVTINVRVETGVKNVFGSNTARKAFGSTTVGDDLIKPEVVISLPPISSPAIVPGSGQDNVDPLTDILVSLSEPVEPWSVGDLPINPTPNISSAILVQFGPETQRVSVPFSILPVSVLDLSSYVLTMAYNFPGEGPDLAACGEFNRIDVSVASDQVRDFNSNRNGLPATTWFLTGEGPGLVNAPVAPDAVYVARGGAEPGVSVIDLNGFGQSTGNPIFDPGFEIFQEGWSNFPNNPNVKLQGSQIRPALTVGACTVDGGSSGVFTLTRDSSLNDLLIRTPVVLKAGDMMLGHALDTNFNNAPAPFGCQSGGGNLCALDGQKTITVMQGGPNTLIPNLPLILNNPILNSTVAGENSISWAPHPNPPPLQFPPLCVSPYIGGQEPTSIFTVLPQPPAPPPNGLGLQNLLVPGNPFGDPLNGVPPDGLLTPEQNAWMQGPHAPQQVIGACLPYMMRQQLGHFMYVVDRARNELVIFNSNSMRVIDRVSMPDPTSLAMSPNLDYLAVTNQSVDLVTFLDINPQSSTFHEVVQNTVVGNAPRGIAWEPGNEDVLVCNEGDSTVSILSAFSLETRKTLISQLNQPFDVAITGRQTNYGFVRGVYFAYILNRTGTLAMYESGPNGVNGWGYDDVIGAAPMEFKNPKSIQPDLINISSAVWVVHEGPIDPSSGSAGAAGVPALSNLKIESGIFGQLPLNVNSLLIPQFRDLSLAVAVSLGPDVLSGVPVDVAFDNQRNYGGLANFFTYASAGFPISLNGKSLVRQLTQTSNTCEPQFMFVAVPNPTFGSDGVVDVVDIAGGYNRKDVNAFVPGTQSIECTNAANLMDYWRQ